MALSCGIIGLPNVGKSTLFNTLTRSQCAAENFPFCTIEPNQGHVGVPDLRIERLSAYVNPKRKISAMMQFVDIAGLVRGASQGAGLGNQFLHHIREVDAIVQVIRCFEDNQVLHVSERIDPVEELEIIQLELALSDLDSIQRGSAKVGTSKLAQNDKKKLQACFKALGALLCEGRAARELSLSDEEQELMRHYPLLTAKPILYVANVGEKQDQHFQTLKSYCDAKRMDLLPVTVSLEYELSTLDAEDRADFLKAGAMQEPAVNGLVRQAFHLLNLQTYFTVGEKEVRAWPMPQGCRAHEAAGIIHSDLKRGFIRAEVIHYADFIQHQGEAGARAAGKLQVEGKDYVVQDGDILHFRFNV